LTTPVSFEPFSNGGPGAVVVDVVKSFNGAGAVVVDSLELFNVGGVTAVVVAVVNVNGVAVLWIEIETFAGGETSSWPSMLS
jgi:hypothetical protein